MSKPRLLHGKVTSGEEVASCLIRGEHCMYTLQ